MKTVNKKRHVKTVRRGPLPPCPAPAHGISAGVLGVLVLLIGGTLLAYYELSRDIQYRFIHGPSYVTDKLRQDERGIFPEVVWVSSSVFTVSLKNCLGYDAGPAIEQISADLENGHNAQADRELHQLKEKLKETP